MKKVSLATRLITSRRQLDRFFFFFKQVAPGVFEPGDQLKITPIQMSRPGVYGDWSMKDLLAYLVDGEQSWLAWWSGLKDPLAGQTPPPPAGLKPPGEQDWPARCSGRTVEQVLEAYRTSFPQFIATIEFIPETDLIETVHISAAEHLSLAETIIRATIDRYDWAKTLIRNWSGACQDWPSKQAVLIKKIQSEHNLLVKSLAGLSTDEWLQPGIVANWTVKDLIAHLTAWEKLFCGWYQAGLCDETPKIPAPGYSWKQINNLNDQIYITNRDRPLEDIQSEFNASYQEVFALIKSIQEEEFIPGRYPWTGKVGLSDYITANTCNHYRWARSKLRAWQRQEVLR